MPSTSSSKQSQPGLNYEEIKSYLESSSGRISVPCGTTDWEDFWQNESSEASSTTQTTKSSSKIVSDDHFSTVVEINGQQYELPKPILGKAQYTPVTKYNPNHYKRGKIEVWDFIEDQSLDFLLGNVIKYVCRAGHKKYEEELDDLIKAKLYIEKKISLISASRNR